MRNGSHKTRIGIIREHVNAWRKAADMSREAVALVIVEAHNASGGPTRTGIYFESGSRDAFTTAKTHADRIFRWLDDESKDSNFLPANFEDSNLLAMPADVRMACLNELLAPFGLVVRGVDVLENRALNATAHLVRIARETSEAQGAVAGLIDGATPGELADADRELAEAEEAIRSARADVRRQMT